VTSIVMAMSASTFAAELVKSKSDCEKNPALRRLQPSTQPHEHALKESTLQRVAAQSHDQKLARFAGCVLHTFVQRNSSDSTQVHSAHGAAF